MKRAWDVWDLLAVVGTALVALGAGLLSVPVGVMAAGLGLCLWAVLGAVANRKA